MAKGKIVLLEESKSAIEKCGQLLKEISDSCCMPERSTNMTEAFNKVDNILQSLDLARNSTDSAHHTIAEIGHFGSMIGFLYATCCTATKEPLYQRMFKQMNNAHGKLGQYMGQSH